MAMGGIGEAAMLGAVMGGGSALLTGADPLKGALMGTLTGGIGGAAGPALSSLTGTAAIAPTVATSMAPTMANAAAMNAVAAPTALTTASQVAPTALSAVPAASATPFAQGTLGSGTFGVMPEATGGIPDLLSKATPQSFGNILGSGSSTLPGISSAAAPSGLPSKDEMFRHGMKKFRDEPIESIKRNYLPAAAAALAGANAGKKKLEEEEEYSGPLSRFKYNPDKYRPSGYADGGITSLGGYDQMVGEEPMYMSNMAAGGIANLGSYSDGGRMLKGPGDGMSDSIPANIAGKRPARLADGEFVIPADVVSHLGNGSTDAGAKQLYAMMDKVRKARTGRKAQGREINPRQYMAA